MILKEEAVQLRLRQGIGAFHFDGILSRHDEERDRQIVQGIAYGYCALVHGFQEGRLRLGRGAVDLIRQDQVVEYRPRLETKEAVVLLVFRDDRRARDIRRHQVGRELNAAVPQIENFPKCLDKFGLAQARHTFEQRVSAGEQANQHAVYDGLLANDDFPQFGANVLAECLEVLDPFFGWP